jgi:hypothetical protein
VTIGDRHSFDWRLNLRSAIANESTIVDPSIGNQALVNPNRQSPIANRQ